VDVTLEQFAGAVRRSLDEFDAYTARLYLDAAIGEVQDYCGWHIAPTVTETVTVDGSGAEVQGLPTMYLLDLVAVSNDGEDLAVADVEWSQDGWLKRPGYWWTSKLRGVEAEIEHGYPTTPAALVALICDMAKPCLTNTGNVVREQSGGESVAYSARDGVAISVELTERGRRMLDRRYRIANRA
jgi:hypothetical protein